jgi:hypothetical protein
MQDWVVQNVPSPWEILFWIAIIWIVVGMLRPMSVDRFRMELASNTPTSSTHSTQGESSTLNSDEELHSPTGNEESPVSLIPAFRNTLVTVIVLFGVYLVFEFKTLWFRVFPDGFYYSGYAHEGAAWLTVALALATVLLSLIFRGNTLHDPQVKTLRKLAWVWSIQNLVLTAAVYHRLFIYVGFNGMTRMRIVGIYGISAVVVGLILVVWKITCRRNFAWLLQRHLWTLALAVFFYALTPVDTIVMRYNVRRILTGDLAPAVQISVQPIDSAGVLELLPLLKSENETIRGGVRAIIAKRFAKAEIREQQLENLGWTAYQVSDQKLLDELRRSKSEWDDPTVRHLHNRNLNRFHKFVYQWF